MMSEEPSTSKWRSKEERMRMRKEERKFKSRYNTDGTERQPRHPSHLRGRAIGMFYANRQRKKQVEIPEITFSENRKHKIDEALRTMEDSPRDINVEFKKKFSTFLTGCIEDKLNSEEEMSQNNSIDTELKEEFENRKNSLMYKKMLEVRQKLPSYKLKNEIINMIATSQVVVISGQTGCGKTTQVSQFILDDFVENGKGSICRVVCTQPRRISAITVSERISAERAERHGIGVGYQIRLEHKFPRDRGSILFCTTGILLRLMQGDARLTNVSHIIIDEIHERSIDSDFLITLLKDVLVKRPNLKLILMSATVNADKFSKYYGNCPHLNIPGFTYPVREYYLEDVLQRTNYTLDILPSKRYKRRREFNSFHESFMLPYVRQIEANKTYSPKVSKMLLDPELEDLINLDLIFRLILNICQFEKDSGGILVFLTGYVEISNLHKRMESCGNFPRNKYLIFPLHSQMPTVNQKQVFDRPPHGIRKIILSTNIAETSITIDDIIFVIDCGKIKYTDYDPKTNNYTFKPQWVALSNADQRRGRAGRTQPGICFHLFTRPRIHFLEKYQKPEVLRCRLENTILGIKALQIGKAGIFLNKLLDPPSPDAVEVSIELLKRLNALDEEENLTALGYHLSRLPITPQLGKMILFGVLFSCLDPVLCIAAALDFKEPFLMPLGKEAEVDTRKMELSNGWMSDHLLLYSVIREYESRDGYSATQFCRENFLCISTLKQLVKMKGQFMEYLREMNFVDSSNFKDSAWNYNSHNTSLIKAVTCAGLYPNVGTIRLQRKHKTPYTIDGDRVNWHPKSILAIDKSVNSPLFVYFVKLRSTANFVHDATIVYPLPIIFFGDKYEYDAETSTIGLADKKLKFKCTEETNSTIKELRDRLNNFLEYKISNPGVIKWSSDKDNVSILKAVKDLITCEDIGILDLDEY